MKEFERAQWRCRRGLLELDIILQRFMDKHYIHMSAQQLQQFETLLSLPDNDLWDLISARKLTKDNHLQSVLRLLQES